MIKEFSKKLLDVAEFHEIDLNDINSVHSLIEYFGKRKREFQEDIEKIIKSETNNIDFCKFLIIDRYEKLIEIYNLEKELRKIYINL